jgi:outer membrane protein TolC
MSGLVRRFYSLIPIIAVLVGCESDETHRLDEQVQGVIRQRQSLDLGSANTNDPVAAPRRSLSPGSRAGDLNYQPPTRNPEGADLPATSCPATQSSGSNAIPGTIPGAIPALIDAPADAPKLDLGQLLTYAIEHGPDYRSAKDDLFVRVIDVLVQRHVWGPQFFERVTAQAVGAPEPGDAAHAAQLIHELGVSQRLPYGGTVAVSGLVDYVENIRNSTADEQLGAGLKIDASLPLLRNAGEPAREDLIQAERNVVYAVRSFEQFRREYLVRVSKQYYELLRLKSQIENRTIQVANYERLSLRMEALARAGRQPYFEVQRSQQQVLFARNNLVNVQEQYASTLDSLKLTIGMPIQRPVTLAATEAILPQPVLDVPESVQTAMKFRLDLQNTSDRVGDARRRVDVAKNQMLPDLDLFARGRVPADRLLDRSGGVSGQVNDNSYTAGASLGVPLDRRVEELNSRRAIVELERAQRELDLASSQVALGVRRSARLIEQARFSLELQERNVVLARRREYGVQLRLRELGPRDFIEAQEDLLSALNRRDDALLALRSSILQYLLDTGQMRVASDGRWLAPAKLVAVGQSLPGSASPQSTQPATAPAPTIAPTTAPSITPATQPDAPTTTQPSPDNQTGNAIVVDAVSSLGQSPIASPASDGATQAQTRPAAANQP